MVIPGLPSLPSKLNDLGTKASHVTSTALPIARSLMLAGGRFYASGEELPQLGHYRLALALDGSYFLTYHRWATRAQVEAAHPRFREFLALKRAHDPGELFTSDWYRHYRTLFTNAAP